MMNLLWWSKEKDSKVIGLSNWKGGVAIFWGREEWRKQNNQFWREDYEIKFSLLSLIYPLEILKNVLHVFLDVLVYTLEDRSVPDI